MLRRVFFIFFVGVLWLLVVRGLAIGDVARLSYEHRDGCKLDNQVERGKAQVIETPMFTEGIRLACWASPEQTALASAIYYFDIPAEAQSVKIRIPYIAEEQGNGNGGSVWIKRAGGGEEATEQLYGDTFILKDNRYLEAINVPVAEYRQDDGRLELHIIAEGSQCIDVRYIEVETYDYPAGERVIKRESPSPTAVESAESSGSGGTERVVERYYYYSPPSSTTYVEYPWWYPYSPYWSYYSGPVWQWEWLDGCWVRVCYSYPYPRYEYYRPIVSVYWDNYWHRHPDYYVTWVDVYRVRHRHRPELLAWDEDCERTRQVYRNSVSRGDPAPAKERVRSVLASHKQRRENPSASWQSDRQNRSDAESRRERVDEWLKTHQKGAPERVDRSETPGGTTKTRRSDALRTKQDSILSATEGGDTKVSAAPSRLDSSGRKVIRPDRNPDSVRHFGEGERISSEPAVKTRRDVEQRVVRTSQSEARLAPSRQEVRENRPSSVREVKQRSDSVRTSPQPQVKERREMNRAPVRTEPRPAPQPQVKQRPEEHSVRSGPSDDDEKDKKKQRSYSTSDRSTRQREGRR